MGLKSPKIMNKLIDICEAALSCYIHWSVDASVLYRQSLALVSQKTRLMECGVFRMRGEGSTTITIYLGFSSKLFFP